MQLHISLSGTECEAKGRPYTLHPAPYTLFPQAPKPATQQNKAIPLNLFNPLACTVSFRQRLNADDLAAHAGDALHFFVHAAVGHFDEHAAAFANGVVVLVGRLILTHPFYFIEKNAVAGRGCGLSAKSILREHETNSPNRARKGYDENFTKVVETPNLTSLLLQ
jgi:hypothetical protein